MRRVALIPFCMMAGWMALAAETPNGAKGASAVPPVLRDQDEVNVEVLLPGKPAPPPEAAKPAVETPAPVAAPATPEAPKAGAPATAGAAAHSSTNTTKVFYPPAFEQNSALFCQKMIGQWTADDARFLLGQPARQRPAYGDNQTVNGQIYAFTDPTGRYKELELDFESGTGLLRTVFVYPLNMTWQECRRQWGGEVSATEANKGRKFYSYMDRRLDVLVDPAGKVISLGLY